MAIIMIPNIIYAVSIIPSCVFLFCGMVLADIPLIIFFVIFAVNHILISFRNSNVL